MHRKQRVDAPGLSSRSVLLALVPVLALAAPALADVTLKEKTVSTGLAGFGNGTTERTWVIAGDRSRSDEQHPYTGRSENLAGGGKAKHGSEIVRLGRELTRSLDPANRKGAKDVQRTNSVDVRRTGKKEKVDGFDAENQLVTGTATAMNELDGGTGSYTIRMDQRLSTQVPGQAEAAAFHRFDGTCAGKTGPDPQARRLSGLMARYGNALRQAAKQLEELKGHPVRGTVTLDFGAGATPGQQARRKQARAESQQASAETKAKKEAKEDDDAMAEAGASSQEPGSGTPGGPTIVTGVLAVTTGAAAVGFDVPSDFKKVERKQPK